MPFPAASTAFASSAQSLPYQRAPRRPVCARRPRACVSPNPAQQSEAPDAPAKVAAPAPPAVLESYDVVPGKIVLNELQLAAQKTALDKLTAKYTQIQLQEEYDASRRFGFVPFSEEFQGRAAMLGFVTGLLTEYWTGYTIPQQIELMANTIGIF
jgi:hypothetical protein